MPVLFENVVKFFGYHFVVKQGDEILAAEDVVIPPGVNKHEDVELPATTTN